MRRLSLLALAVLVSACAASTSSSRYDAELDRTFFESRPVSLGQPLGGSGLGGASISLQANASCVGRDCMPSTYDVSLSKEGGSDAMTDYTSISFETADGTVSFGSGAGAGSAARFYSAAQGEIVRLSLPADIFASFAEAPRLTIRLGGTAYTLTYDRRSGLRSLLPRSTES